uniref:MFS domain-containing protein n=1 Tax=Steinernema glaseri TaxID=37863 RepID=A0A1I7ZY30_9BILA
MDAKDALLEGGPEPTRTEDGQEEEKMSLLQEKEIEEKKFVGPDDVLDELGAKNGYIVFIFLAMSFVWCLSAPHSVISAFINESDESHCTSNSTDCIPTISLRSEFTLYGEKASLAATSVSLFMVGDIFGGFALTALSDRYGRKPAVCTSILGLGVFGCLSAVAPNIYAFLVTRFLLGTFFSGSTLVNWVLSYECTPHSIRSFTTMLFGAMWVLGYCALAPLAYVLHDWRLIMAATAIPGIVVGITYALPLLLFCYCLSAVPRLARTESRVAEVRRGSGLSQGNLKTIQLKQWRHLL